MLEKAAELLRMHGINAYEQGDTIAVFAASTTQWLEVYRWKFNYADVNTDNDPAEVAYFIAAQLMDLVVLPHSHDIPR